MVLKNLLLFGLMFMPVLATACKQDLPSRLSQDGVFGTVQGLRTTDNEKMLVYVQGDDPTKKNWGLAGGYYITVDGKTYLLHWDEAEKYKGLKEGDKVNMHPSEYIACTGETDLKPTCYRMMKVFKSERRVDPLETR